MPLTFRKRRQPNLAAFRALFPRVRGLSPGQAPDRPLLRDLAKAWANPGFSAGYPYLRRIAECAGAGPILECGSGLSTIMMAMITAERRTPILSLEHTPIWRQRVQSVLDALDLSHARVLDCPVVRFGLYDWYQVPEALPEGIRLVVCDGPPGRDTRGGRYGLLPQIGDRLHPDATILLDDSHRRGERRVIDTWQRHRPFHVRSHGTLLRFAEMTAG